MVKFSFKIHKKRDIIKIILGFIEYNFLNFSKNNFNMLHDIYKFEVLLTINQ